MYDVAHQAGTAKRYIPSVVWAGIPLSAILFFCGCQADRQAFLEDTAVQYAQLKTKAQKNPSAARQDEIFVSGSSSNLAAPMVQLASFELAQAGQGDQDYLTGGQDRPLPAPTPAGRTKWDTLKSDLLELPQVTWNNTKTVVKRPENLLILGVAGGFSIWGELDFDHHVDEQLRGREVIGRDMTIAVGTAGNPSSHFGLAAALYAHGLLTDNSQTYDFGKTLTHALALNGLATVGLKLVAFNRAPNGHYFGWPSGHTSSSMTVASVVHEYYGLLPAAPLYALTGLVMYERMITGGHWASDVIFGAALGYVVGHTVAGQHRVQVFGMDVVPYNDPYTGSTGIGLVKTW